MYADDTTLFCNMDNNVDEHVINNELCKISEWLGANKLSLNISTRCTRGDASSFFLYLQNVFVHVCTKQNLS